MKRTKDGEPVGIASPSEDPARDEQQLFLEAMRRLEAAPHLVPQKDPATSSRSTASTGVKGAPKRRKRRDLSVDRRLDLHGMTRREALAHLGRLLPELRRSGVRRVVVVTGRGLHSADGRARLRDAVDAWLRGAGARYVTGFERAPPALGGEGALLVALR